MSEGSRVEMASDNLASRQWGRGFFFFQEGKKLSLNTKRAAAAMGAVTVLLAIIQLTYDAPAPASSSAPVMLGNERLTPPEVRQIPVAEAREEPGEALPSLKAAPPTKLTGPQVVSRPRNLSAVPPGAMIRAVLVSGASNGLVRAEVKERLIAGGEMLLEEGTILVGQGNSTEERLMVHFQQAVFRDGTFGAIDGHACDGADKIVGLKGSKIGNRALNIAGSIGLGFVGGLTEGLQDTQGQQGVLVRPPSMKNALLNATATTALEQSRNLMGELKDRRSIIEVPQGTPICVIFGAGG